MAKGLSKSKQELKEYIRSIFPNLVHKYKLGNTNLVFSEEESTHAEEPYPQLFFINFNINDMFSKKHQIWLRYLGLTGLTIKEQCVAVLLHEIRHIIQRKQKEEFYEKPNVNGLVEYMLTHEEMDANVWMLNELSNLDMVKVLFKSNNTKPKHLNSTVYYTNCVKRVDNNTKHRRTKT